MAFLVQDSITKKIKGHSQLVQWKGAVYENNEIVQEIGVHKCTDADYKQFYPSKDIKIAEYMKLKAFWCLD